MKHKKTAMTQRPSAGVSWVTRLLLRILVCQSVLLTKAFVETAVESGNSRNSMTGSGSAPFEAPATACPTSPSLLDSVSAHPHMDGYTTPGAESRQGDGVL